MEIAIWRQARGPDDDGGNRLPPRPLPTLPRHLLLYMVGSSALTLALALALALIAVTVYYRARSRPGEAREGPDGCSAGGYSHPPWHPMLRQKAPMIRQKASG